MPGTEDLGGRAIEEEGGLNSKEEATPCSKDGMLGCSGPSLSPPAAEGGGAAEDERNRHAGGHEEVKSAAREFWQHATTHGEYTPEDLREAVKRGDRMLDEAGG